MKSYGTVALKEVGVYINSEYDEVMNALLNTVSRYAVDLVKQQYDFALLSTTEYRSYPMGPHVMMQYATGKTDDIREEYLLNPQEWTCSCIFRVTRLLPCRHIIYYRKISSCSKLVPENVFHPRWLIKNYKKLRRNCVEDADISFEIRTVSKSTALRPTPQNDKFNDLLSIGRQIADVGSTWGTSAHNNLHCTHSRSVAWRPELDKNPSIDDEVTAQEENITRTHVMIPYGRAVNVSKVDSVDHHLKDSDKASSNSDEQSATSAQSQNWLLNAAQATTTSSQSQKAPDWKIAPSKKRSGRSKVKKKSRKEAHMTVSTGLHC
ncbi:unnamed protein product [Phytophthora fragariaefolia]|uniref:Unnamed protein product n=1 Tax=Phytophthora fragariaefolia TaxID=1490495 RepID=A0A9W6X1P3_9STRA|nr:unnamed protein product [Phytophthora fragariaefolia]